MTICTVSLRSVRFSRRTTCSLMVRSTLVMTLLIHTAQTLVRNSSLQTLRMLTTVQRRHHPKARMWTTIMLMSMMPTVILSMSIQAVQRRTVWLTRRPQSANSNGMRRTVSLLLMTMASWLTTGMMQMASALWRLLARVTKFMWTQSLLEVARTPPSSHSMYHLISLPTKADATPSTSISVASVSFPRLETLTLTVLTHAASSMQVARLMACLLIIRLNILSSCRLSRIIMQPLQCRTMARTTTIMSMVRASAAMTAAWRLRRHVLWQEQWRTISKRATHTRRCSSTITQTIWVVVVTLPILMVR